MWPAQRGRKHPQPRGDNDPRRFQPWRLPALLIGRWEPVPGIQATLRGAEKSLDRPRQFRGVHSIPVFSGAGFCLRYPVCLGNQQRSIPAHLDMRRSKFVRRSSRSNRSSRLFASMSQVWAMFSRMALCSGASAASDSTRHSAACARYSDAFFNVPFPAIRVGNKRRINQLVPQKGGGTFVLKRGHWLNPDGKGPVPKVQKEHIANGEQKGYSRFLSSIPAPAGRSSVCRRVESLHKES
jgi:hypothetical protein